ncbi:MAG TPA: galactose oxidase-like domain-containing protein [Solirubrobacterales bacterium]|nr:galactose oxidase-like domain-containing protein [Solirubrobacterales bacterium]
MLAFGAGSASAAGVAVDKTVTTHQASASGTIASPAFSTAAPGELLLAFITSDGPSTGGSQTFSKVTGGGLTWRLRRRANTQAGTAEIWAANAPATLASATVTATRGSGSYSGSITVVTFTGADQVVDGSTAAASGSTGAPSVALATTRAGSWVWGVGNDWDRATARTVGANQTKVDEFLAPFGDTMWVQRQTAATPFSGTQVTLNDTAPTADRWNLAAIEVLPAVTDTQAPTAPTNLAAGLVTAKQVPLSWSASTDDQGVAGYRILRGASQVGEVPGTSFTDTTVAASTAYTYTVKAYDAAGNVSAASEPVSVTTPAGVDATPPTVSLTAPAGGATVSGTANLTATASDASGVAGVQFLLDGSPLGAEDTSAPYALAWDSTTVANGSHTLAARARDGAGNTATSTAAAVTVANGGTGPAQVGQWGPLISLPAVAIHSALLPSGRIVLFQGDFAAGGQQYVLDPQTGAVTHVPDAAADLFCAGQAVLADGRVLVVGGTATDEGLGVPDITAFDWHSETWSALAPMQFPRWYATGTTLSDGKVLATSGYNRDSSDIVTAPELYSPGSNTWQTLTAASHSMPIYPFIYQLPDGRIAHLGGSEEPTASEVLDLSTNKWTTIDSRVIEGGSIANYAPGRFIKAGSAADDGFSGNSLKTAYTLNMNAPGAIWQPTGSMAFPRSFLNLTNLPDGSVLASGGGTDKSGFVDANAVLPAEDWNPSTGAWTTYAAMTTPRLYHSVAVLLPDGRVYVAGGGGDPGVSDQRSAQIFSPPYLFKGARPTISSAPATVKYGSTAFVGTPDAASISRVSLIRTGSVTHAFDQNARATALTFSQTVGGLNVDLPANRNDVPPGYYMLFLVNGEGVPSVASFVRFPAPYEDATAPTAPTSLSATGGVGSASLSWTAATDDTAVTRYNIHRSSTPNFTPTAANRVGQTSSTSFSEVGVPAGAWYYKVTAEDAAGNVGPASAEAPATVTLDTAPPSVPAGLKGSAGNTSALLAWSASTDNVGVAGYRVLRNGAPIGTAPSTGFTDTGLTPSTAYTYAVAAYDAAGNESVPSAPIAVTTSAAPSFALDKTVTTRQSTAGPTISAPPLTTAQPDELLLAFVSSDGPSSASSQSIVGVSGGGLTWTLRRRTNAQAGTAEIWQTVAPATLTNAVVTATRASGSYQGAITVAAFVGADTAVNGAVGSGAAATGAPSASLVTTRAGSWVWAVGEDWDKASSRTVGPGQTLVDQFPSPSGDTFWTQRQTAPTPAAGTTVVINDTAPTADRWDLALVEVLPATAP